MKPILFITIFIFLGSDYLRAEDPFIRMKKGEFGEVCLQVAVRRYLLPQHEDKELLLVGVSHVGTQAYYETLQLELDQAAIVLFEGIDGHRDAFIHSSEEESPARSSLQANLSRALGLAFQLHHIDYTRQHFVNSDVTSTELIALFDGKNLDDVASDGKQEFKEIMDTLQQTSLSGRAFASLLEVFKQKPSWGKGLRWGLVNILGSVTGNFSEYPGLPDHYKKMMNVLIERRNEVVMQDIHAYVEKIQPKQTLAVFYGAAHMHDFEERLVDEFAVTLLASEWVTAFCGNLQTSGLNVLQKKLLSWFVTQQVRTMQWVSQSLHQKED